MIFSKKNKNIMYPSTELNRVSNILDKDQPKDNPG